MTGFVNDRVLNKEDVTGISILMEYRHRTVVLVSPDKVNPSPNPKQNRGYPRVPAGTDREWRVRVRVPVAS